MENETPDNDELQLLRDALWKTTWDEDTREEMYKLINNCTDYPRYEGLKWLIEDATQNIDFVINPSQGDINKHLRKFIKPEKNEDTSR